MNDVGAMLADGMSERRQLTQIADDAFASDTIAQHLYAARLECSHLLFNERRKTSVFIGCYDEDFHIIW